MKKILHSIFVVIILVAMLIPFYPNYSVANNVYTEDGVTATLSDDGTLTISGTGEIKDSLINKTDRSFKKLVIKEGITRIDNIVFSNCDDLISVELSNSSQEFVIGPRSFYGCDNLKTVIFPNNKVFIGDQAFALCSNLELSEIPSNVETICQGAFIGCDSLKNIKISSKKIYGNAFENCDNLESVELTKDVEKIGIGAFFYCNKLKSVTIYNSELEIEDNGMFSAEDDRENIVVYGYENSTAQAMYEEYINEHGWTTEQIQFVIIGQEPQEEPEQPVVEDDSIITIKGITYKINPNYDIVTVINVDNTALDSNGQLTIPSTITSKSNKTYTITRIAENAVTIENINKLVLPESLLVIENNAFTTYKGNVEIPKNVVELDINSFSTHQATISINKDNTKLKCNDYNMALYGISEKKKVLYGYMHNFIEEQALITVPEDVIEIEERAFKYCNNFQKIRIGYKVIKIAEDAFEGIENRVIIQGYEGSEAQTYANKHNIQFESLGKMPYFRWTQDNYSFTNSKKYFSSYTIGDFKSLCSNSLLEHCEDRLNKTWGGSCYGMAATTILFKKHFLTQEYWKNEYSQTNYTYDLESPLDNKKLEWLINFYQVFQSFLDGGCFEQIDSFNVYDIAELVGEGKAVYTIQKFYDSVKQYYHDNDHALLLCSFGWEREGKDVGHAIVINDAPEELDDEFYRERNLEFNSKDYYGYRVPVYDVNEESQMYIYIKNDFSKIALGDNDSIEKSISTTTDKSGNSSVVPNYLQAHKLNYSEIFSLEDVIKYKDKHIFETFYTDDYYVEYKDKCAVKITDSEGKYSTIKEINDAEGNLDINIHPIVGANPDGIITDVSVKLKKDDKYTLETINDTDPLDFNVLTSDSYMAAKTTAGGKVIFENKKGVTLSNPTGKEYEVLITLNEDYKTAPWYTIKVTGTGAKQIIEEIGSEGILITGDNLQKFVVTGNNDSESTIMNLSTEKNTVLIKANEINKTLSAFIDNDNNGTYETLIGESTNDSTVADKDLSNTGNATVLIICLVIGLILIVFCLIKYRIYKKLF